MKHESKAPAIARAAAILRLLGKSPTPLGVNPIARALGLVPSTCLYVLRALAEEELVAFDPVTKLYALDAGVLALARGWLRRNSFAELAQPMLDELAQEHGITMLGVQVGSLDHRIVVCKALGGGSSFQLNAELGSRFPALISATGRCIAAFGSHSPDLIKSRFGALRWDNPPTYETWLEQVETVRSRMYAIDDGNYIAGVTVVAAPVLNRMEIPSHAVIAIGISGAVHRVGIEQLGAALVKAVQSIAGNMP